MNKKINIILVIIILILLGIIIYFSIVNKKTNNNMENDIYKDENSSEYIEENSNIENINELTKEEAIDKLKLIDNEKLDLPTKVSEYDVEVVGETVIDNISCYELCTFSQLENRKYNMGTFAISKDGSKVYKIVDGRYSEI